MKVLLNVFCLCFLGILSAQQLLPIENYTSDIGEAHRVLINEYGVYSFDQVGDGTKIYHSLASDTVSSRRLVDSLNFKFGNYDFTTSSDKLSGLISLGKPSPVDSVVLQLDTLFLFHISDTFEFKRSLVQVEFVDSTLGIQWFLGAFSDKKCLVMPFNSTLDLSRINIPDSAKLISFDNFRTEIVPYPDAVSFDALTMVDSFFYIFGKHENFKIDINSGNISDTVFVFRSGETGLGGEPTVFFKDGCFYKCTNVSSLLDRRDGRGLVYIRIEKFNKKLEELSTVLLYEDEGVYSDMTMNLVSGSYNNVFVSENNLVFHATYAVLDSLLFSSVLNEDLTIRSSYSFKLDRELYIDQVYPYEVDSILFVTGYEFVNVFSQRFDSIPIVYAIDYSVGGVSSGTLLPVTTNTSIRVYPNPASSWITVQCKSCEQDVSDLQTAIIFSSTGKIVSESRVESGRVDVSLLQPGTYQMLFLKENGHPVGASTLIKN